MSGLNMSCRLLALLFATVAPRFAAAAAISAAATDEKLLVLDNGVTRIGIDPAKGGSITWLSWSGQPKNVVNHADPGRLIQQSYYAGHRLDRRAEGQSKAWSPWTWNPIQGGGVGSWARVTEMKRQEDGTLYAETVPRLWDMPGEEAAARMRQWTAFEPGMPDVVVVRCEIICQRDPGDRWGPAAPRPQEIPACYFTRRFSDVRSFLGEGKWRSETQPPGPPWGKAQPPRKAMACFAPNGQGVAVFSPASTQHWNFGPHAGGASDDSAAGPCMHVAPLDRVPLGPRSVYRYRYWLVVGTEAKIAARLETLWAKYSGERAELQEGLSTAAAEKPTKKRPNIILIYSDDHGWADQGVQGADADIRTPHLDAMAREGVRFTRGYVSAPQCVPSRAGVITGRYQQRFGVEDNLKGPLPLAEITIAERLKPAGYVSCQVGKWHLEPTPRSGPKAPGENEFTYLPVGQGFDEYFTGPMNNFIASHDLKGNRLADAPRRLTDPRFRCVWQTDAAVSFIERHAREPFFLYLAYFTPHVPLESPEPWFAKTPAHLPKERRQALAMMAAMDDGVGRIRARLRELKLEKNTLVFFIGDNGAPLKEGAWNGSLNIPLIGEKGMLTDGGVRVPFVAAWPGTLPAGKTYDRPVIALDVAATAAALAGLPPDPALDGVNLMPFLLGRQSGSPHEALYWRWRSQAAVRTDRWKLILLGPETRFLFDLESPEAESKNRLAENPAIAAELEKKLMIWNATLPPPGLPRELNAQDQLFFDSHVNKTGAVAVKRGAAKGGAKKGAGARKP